jgi:hypothetical protein
MKYLGFIHLEILHNFHSHKIDYGIFSYFPKVKIRPLARFVTLRRMAHLLDLYGAYPASQQEWASRGERASRATIDAC